MPMLIVDSCGATDIPPEVRNEQGWNAGPTCVSAPTRITNEGFLVCLLQTNECRGGTACTYGITDRSCGSTVLMVYMSPHRVLDSYKSRYCCERNPDDGPENACMPVFDIRQTLWFGH